MGRLIKGAACMDDRFRLTYLADIYGGLLTEKQQDILNRYLNEDMSISEIAKDEDISRQAAFDLLKRSEKLLEGYDEKLGLFERYLKNSETLSGIEELCGDIPGVKELLDRLRDNI